jgi:bacterioferritin
MDREQIIADLNEILALEYTAVIQYTYQTFVVRGLDRPRFVTMFQSEATESLAHAHLVGSKIVALGGKPTTEVGAINPATDLRTMLENDLAMERRAVELYTRALAHAGDDVSLRTLLEGQVAAEKSSVEEFELILG